MASEGILAPDDSVLVHLPAACQAARSVDGKECV